MKLLTTYNRANITAAIIILLIISTTYYFIIRSILIQQIDKDLKVEEQEIYAYVKENNSLPKSSQYKGQAIRFEPANAKNIKRKITTSTINDAVKNEDEPVRMLSFPLKVNNVLYKAIVIKSQVEAEYLVKIIMTVTAIIFFLLLIILSLINRFVLRRLWEPFYHTLNRLREYDIKNSKILKLPVVDVSEFNELNLSVTEMTKRVNHDFEALKTFTDNASHEMQTPLAVINAKLDILLQTSDEKQAAQLQAIYDATERLAKLNQTLLLLTKINNEQYRNVSTVAFEKLLQQKLRQFDELIKGKNIRLSLKSTPVCLQVNEELADILLNNLFSNAIKHNYTSGYINCALTSEKFSITNSGPPLTFDREHIFDRFQKSNHSGGTGLGLAVVKEICESSGIQITYAYSDNEHNFTITF